MASRRLTPLPQALLMAAVVVGTAALLPGGEPPAALLARAEQAWQKDDLQTAERLYAAALKIADGDAAHTCRSRLLRIYVRWGRHDRAIATAGELRKAVRRGNPRAPVHEIDWQLGISYFTLGHLKEARTHLEASLEAPTGTILSPRARIQAVDTLAQIALRTKTDPAVWWSRLDQLEKTLPPAVSPDLQRDGIAVAWLLSDADMARGRPESACRRLTALLVVHEQLADRPGRAETLLRRARTWGPSSARPEVEQDLRQALAGLEQVAPPEWMLRGDVIAALMEWHRPRDPAAASRWHEAAVTAYSKLLDAPAGRRVETAAVSAYWKLQALYRRTADFDKALELSTAQGAEPRPPAQAPLEGAARRTVGATPALCRRPARASRSRRPDGVSAAAEPERAAPRAALSGSCRTGERRCPCGLRDGQKVHRRLPGTARRLRAGRGSRDAGDGAGA